MFRFCAMQSADYILQFLDVTHLPSALFSVKGVTSIENLTPCLSSNPVSFFAMPANWPITARPRLSGSSNQSLLQFTQTRGKVPNFFNETSKLLPQCLHSNRNANMSDTSINCFVWLVMSLPQPNYLPSKNPARFRLPLQACSAEN